MAAKKGKRKPKYRVGQVVMARKNFKFGTGYCGIVLAAAKLRSEYRIHWFGSNWYGVWEDGCDLRPLTAREKGQP